MVGSSPSEAGEGWYGSMMERLGCASPRKPPLAIACNTLDGPCTPPPPAEAPRGRAAAAAAAIGTSAASVMGKTAESTRRSVLSGLSRFHHLVTSHSGHWTQSVFQSVFNSRNDDGWNDGWSDHSDNEWSAAEWSDDAFEGYTDAPTTSDAYSRHTSHHSLPPSLNHPSLPRSLPPSLPPSLPRSLPRHSPSSPSRESRDRFSSRDRLGDGLAVGAPMAQLLGVPLTPEVLGLADDWAGRDWAPPTPKLHRTWLDDTSPGVGTSPGLTPISATPVSARGRQRRQQSSSAAPAAWEQARSHTHTHSFPYVTPHDFVYITCTSLLFWAAP